MRGATFNIDEKKFDRIRRIAMKQGLTFSEYMRLLVNKDIDSKRIIRRKKNA